MVDKRVNDTYEIYWKCIIEDKNGTLNVDNLKEELYGYSLVMNNCTQAYTEMTNGKITRPTTDFAEVLKIFKDSYCKKKE